MVNALTPIINFAKSSKWLFGLFFVTVLLTVWTSFREDESELLGTTINYSNSETNSQYKKVKYQKRVNNPDIKTVTLDEKNNASFITPWEIPLRQPLNHDIENAFRTHSWVVVEVPKKEKFLPPKPPSAPPVPFIFVGKLENTPNGNQYFLMANNRLHLVFKGEKINEQWRFDEEDANVLHFTYMPLNSQETVSKSAKSHEQSNSATAEVGQ